MCAWRCVGVVAWLWTGVLAAAPAVPAAKQAARPAPTVSFPYIGRLTGNDVYVRSGPGANFYRTGKLHKGEQVVVVRQDPGRWLAIVPPDGSFNWVSARYVAVRADGVGVVTGHNLRVRVGTPISTVRDIHHQKLTKGARVKILERRQIPVGNAAETWYRIAPPLGELRWVTGRYVTYVKPYPGRLADAYPAPELGRARPAASRPGAPGATGTPGAAPDPGPRLYQQAREGVEQVQAKDLAEWDFASPKALGKRVLAESADPTTKALTESLLRRIGELEQIKARYDRIASSQRETDRQIAAIAAKARGREATTQPSAVGKVFDGRGLVQRTLVAFDNGKIRFKLTRPEDTRVLYFLESPGIDLTPYVNKRVRVRGRLSFRRDLDSHHILVTEVTP